MSLLDFVKLPEVAAKIKPLRPKVRKHGVPLKVTPRSTRYMLIGTAFDYLLRFELQRRVPHAVAKDWVAEHALDRVYRKTDSATIMLDLFADAPPEQYIPPGEVVKRMRRLLMDAKSSLETYRKQTAPSVAEQTELASHAIRLAKLDSVYRAMILEPTFEKAEPEDVQELVELLAIIPSDLFATAKTMLLNPDFGAASLLVGGADADVIAGGALVDIKTTKSDAIEGKHLDQLFGYLLLARRHRTENPSFPEVNRLGLYFSRHGHLWMLDAANWISHPEFPAVEQWFFKRAEELSKTGNA